MLTEMKDTSEIYSEREVICISLCNFPAHDFKQEECKEVTYRVYCCITSLQGYPDILSCDLKIHVFVWSAHVIMKSHEIH